MLIKALHNIVIKPIIAFLVPAGAWLLSVLSVVAIALLIGKKMARQDAGGDVVLVLGIVAIAGAAFAVSAIYLLIKLGVSLTSEVKKEKRLLETHAKWNELDYIQVEEDYMTECNKGHIADLDNTPDGTYYVTDYPSDTPNDNGIIVSSVFGVGPLLDWCRLVLSTRKDGIRHFSLSGTALLGFSPIGCTLHCNDQYAIIPVSWLRKGFNNNGRRTPRFTYGSTDVVFVEESKLDDFLKRYSLHLI